MRERFLENWKEKVLYGCQLGGVLFISTVIYLGLQKEQDVTLRLLPYLSLLLAAELLFGIGFILVYKRKRKKESLFSEWFKGAAAKYWTDLLVIAVMGGAAMLGSFSAERGVILLHAVLLVGFMVLDYFSLVKLAKELNRYVTRRFVLIEDLDEAPKTVQEFCDAIETYCEKSGHSVVFRSWGIPAQIELDGEPCTVELDQSYSQFGPLYSLKFVKEKHIENVQKP